jgi:CRISPR-associated endonuclease/helicase Cas3
MILTTWQRLHAVIDLLTDSYPKGLTTGQIGERLDVTRQTARNDLDRLLDWDVPIEDAERHNHYTIDPKKHMRPLNLNLPQAWQLYLPLRKMVRAQQHESQLVYSLLQRLTTSLNDVIASNLVPNIDPNQDTDNTFRELVSAWRDQLLIEVLYKPPNQPANRHLIAPYWFEPAVWSDGTYLIAGLPRKDSTFEPITLKLNRVQQAVTRPNTLFDRPAPQDILDRLQGTWGIWLGDKPIIVRLRFTNRTRQRLLETRWHPTEQWSDEEDGSVLWWATIEEPQEMLPWIRGWGPDVEVLEPQSIRDEIAIAADRTARMYGFCEGDDGYF